MSICTLGLIFLMLLQGEGLKNGWKGIRPLRTTRAEVEERIGNRLFTDRDYYYVDYNTDEGRIEVNYSVVPCSEDKYSRGRYSVEHDTVLDYIVLLKRPLRPTETDIDFARYTRSHGDATDYTTYENRDEGIIITTKTSTDGEELVDRIEYHATKTDAEKVKCKT